MQSIKLEGEWDERPDVGGSRAGAGGGGAADGVDELLRRYLRGAEEPAGWVAVLNGAVLARA